jgi:hypothetical protein
MRYLADCNAGNIGRTRICVIEMLIVALVMPS